MKHLEKPITESAEQLHPHQTEFSMRVAVCAWCKPVPGAGISVWSHGICPRHLRKMRLKMIKQTSPARKHS
jgi:hypothetical protein